MIKKCCAILVFLFILLSISLTAFAEDRKPVVIPGKTFLPLKVLTRPFANIYQNPDESSAIIKENVKVFQSFFVYTRPDVSISEIAAEGWYEVGENNRGAVIGWMKADDVMEWKQTMCLAYEHPSGRKPVLMFEDLSALRDLVKMPGEDRISKANTYYDQIKSGKIPSDFPVISMEPEDAIDIRDKFYLLPILEHAAIEIEGREGRLLKMAAATQSGIGGQTLKENPEAFTPEKDTSGDASNPEAEMFKKLNMDIVYVVDMTGSMDPYIKATLDAIKNISLKVSKDAEIAESVRFGLWGYRDSMDIPGIEFTTKNFTPEMQKVTDFEKTLAGVEVAKVGSKDYEEDVFAGMDKAMQETEWTENALKMIILLGDAPSHAPGHKWNHSGQSAETLRTFADDNKYNIFAFHIKDPRAKDYWDAAERQFRTLSLNRGVDEATYWSVLSNDMDAFGKASKEIADSFVTLLKDVKVGKVTYDEIKDTADLGTAGPEPQKAEAAGDAGEKAKKLGYAALVDWIGKEKNTPAPADIIAWVTDKDLIDPAIPSMDVRVLINKKQIDSLRTILQEVMTAGRRGLIGGEKFFDALQAIPSAAARGGEQIRSAASLAETGLLPEFMTDLPYRSQVMTMSNELWGSWSMDQQEEFLNHVDAKIKLYVAIHNEPDGWIALHPGDDPDEHVYPLSLTALP